MSIETLSLALNHSRASGTAKVVLIGIANHDGDGGSWPAIETLARYANVSPRNVQKAIRTLEQLDEIRVYSQGGGTRHTPDHMRTNRYEITLRCPIGCDGTSQHRTRVPLEGLESHPLSISSPPVGIVTPPVSDSSPEPPINHPTLNKEISIPLVSNAREETTSEPVEPYTESEMIRVEILTSATVCDKGTKSKPHHRFPMGSRWCFGCGKSIDELTPESTPA